MKNYTIKELQQMSMEQLSKIRRSLAQFVGTEYEQQARMLNQLIGDIMHDKMGWGD